MSSQLKTQDKSFTFGSSFSPELIKQDKSLRLPALKFIVEELGIKDIRLGIRWNKTHQKSKKPDISFYEKYLDYCFSKNVRLTLNIGPIKTFRWPEEHIPEELLDSYVTAIKSKKITLATEISKHALAYLSELLELLKQRYGKNLEFITVQPENEAFFPFGINKIYMGEDYLLEVIKQIKQELPRNKIMINSAGRLNLHQIVDFWRLIVQKRLYAFEDLTLGFNFYYKTGLLSKIPFIQAFDPIIFAPPWAMSVDKLKKLSQELGFKVEISEAQFESWEDQTDPGSKVVDLDFLLKRSMKIFPNRQERKVIRLWGLESFALKNINQTCTEEEKEICRRILEFKTN